MSINREQLEAQLAEVARRRQIAQQLSQPPQRTQQAGNMVVPYSAAEGLAALGQAWLGRRANKKLDEKEAAARTGYATTVKGAQDEFNRSVPDAQVPGEIIKRVMAAPPDQLMEPVVGRGEATRKLADVALGPTAAAEMTVARENAANAPYTLGAGQQRRGAGNELLADNPAATTGTNSRYGNPQIGPNGNIMVLDRSTGQYTDTGKTASANMRLITLPDGSVQAVDMRQPVTDGKSPATASVVSPTTAVDAAAARARAEAEAKAQVVPADERLTAQNKGARVDAARRRLERVSQASDALENNLLSGGPMQGRVVGMTEEGNELDQANAQLLTELTALTRTPGLGSQSDFEQRLAQLVLPTADMYPSVRKKAIAELEAFMGDLDSQIRRIGRGEQPPPAPQSGPQPTGGAMPTFATEAEAEAAGLAPGTRVTIGGKTGTWQ